MLSGIASTGERCGLPWAEIAENGDLLRGVDRAVPGGGPRHALTFAAAARPGGGVVVAPFAWALQTRARRQSKGIRTCPPGRSQEEIEQIRPALSSLSCWIPPCRTERRDDLLGRELTCCCRVVAVAVA
jgi:hypothetical protein